MGLLFRGGFILLLVIVLLVVLVVVWGVTTYNRLVRLRRLRDEAWSGIAVQLKRRADLVPNLVNTVKGYAGHEKGLLEELTRLRAAAGAEPAAAPTAKGIAAASEAEGSFGRTLVRVFALAEAYPVLQADKNFLALQNSLGEIEDSLQMARRYFNGTVRDYNIQVESFPGILIARQLSLSPLPFFEISDKEAEKNPKVQF